VIVGGGEREQLLRHQVQVLNIGDRVLFTGIRSDVAQLLPGFDVSCLSSVHEGAPLTVLESMAAGLPIVSTRCGALADMVADREEGFLVPVGDHAALADRLGQLADDAELRAAMGERARLRAESEYSIEHTVAGYERLLTELVSR
jgi:glycosyltransferase involved in cell wall biosynthesis